MTQLVVQDISPRVQYVANSGQTTFTFAFLAFAASDVVVYLTPNGNTADDQTDILTYNTQYTVTLNPQPSVGGEITLVTPASTGDIVTIVRAQADERLNYYIDGGLFLASEVNTDFDQEVLMIQQNTMYNTKVTPHYNLSASPDPIIDIYLPVLGPNQCWVKNSTDTAIVATDFTTGGGGGGSGVTQINTTSPISGGPITSTGTISHATSGVTAGTYINANITVNSSGHVTSASNGDTTTSSTLAFTVNQSAHGFVVGDILKCTGANTYAKAQADSAANAEVVGVVSQVVDTNDFVLQIAGLVTGVSGLSAGSTYYLSPTSAGAMTATRPTTTTQVVKPIGVAISTTSFIMTNLLGVVL